jgi:integrase
LAEKNIGYRTASNYLSNLNKVSDALSLNSKEIQTLRKELSNSLSRPTNQTRAYDLTQVKINPRSDIPFTLQKEYGLRVSASIRINLKTQLNQNTLSFKQKGGKLSEITLSRTLASKIRENASEGKFELNYRTYYRDLQKAIEKTGQKFNGTHGIRHSFAQAQLEYKTKQEVSELLGHVREEITLVYLR